MNSGIFRALDLLRKFGNFIYIYIYTQTDLIDERNLKQISRAPKNFMLSGSITETSESIYLGIGNNPESNPKPPQIASRLCADFIAA